MSISTLNLPRLVIVTTAFLFFCCLYWTIIKFILYFLWKRVFVLWKAYRTLSFSQSELLWTLWFIDIMLERYLWYRYFSKFQLGNMPVMLTMLRSMLSFRNYCSALISTVSDCKVRLYGDKHPTPHAPNSLSMYRIFF